jgi:hypothetical protein
MKKTLLIFLVFMAFGAAVFGQSFMALSVSGRVEREKRGGGWDPVKAGDALAGETVIRTGIGARLTLSFGERTLSVGAAQTGALATLAENSTGIRIDGRVVQTDTGPLSRNTGRIGTAAARAGDAAEKDDIAVE